ncbi:MAG: hypothetical protein FJ403_00940 [Verrucomicrobia bacterium]|nr:hypothetical protein [Verrucomicrobiota bacterium]
MSAADVQKCSRCLQFCSNQQFINETILARLAAAFEFSGQIPEGSRCLYSYWSGYLDKPEWKECVAVLKQAGAEVIPCHTSGHIFAQDILRFVNAIKPHKVVPIHTFAPEAFRRHFPNARLLKDEETWAVE